MPIFKNQYCNFKCNFNPNLIYFQHYSAKIFPNYLTCKFPFDYGFLRRYNKYLKQNEDKAIHYCCLISISIEIIITLLIIRIYLQLYGIDIVYAITKKSYLLLQQQKSSYYNELRQTKVLLHFIYNFAALLINPHKYGQLRN